MAVQQAETLVERTEALAALDELIAGLERGDGSAIAIEAAAGLGKTALLGVTRHRAAARGVEVASARGGEFEGDFPFGVARQLFEPLLARAAPSERAQLLDGAARRAVAVVGAPDDAEPFEAPALGPIGQPDGPALHALYWLLANVAERGPLLVVVDDAHWADGASMRWLHYVTRRLEGLRVGVVAAARPGEQAGGQAAFAALAAEPVTRVVTLGALTDAGSARMVRGAFGGDVDDAFAAACHQASDGNPFLLHELTSALIRDGVEPVAAAAPQVRALVPETVARSLVLRLARLPEAGPALARAVAVLGAASLHDAAAVARLREPDAARAAATLAGVAILAPGLPLDFVHPLVRAAIYDDVPAGERALWHARAARVLAAGGARPERVAAQLLRAEPAGDPWVVARLRAAAADAMASADPRSATTFLERAFAEPVPADQRVAVVEELVAAGYAAGDVKSAQELLADPVEELSADPRALEANAYPLGLLLWIQGRSAEAEELLGRVVAAADARGDLDRVLDLELRRVALAQLRPKEALARLAPYLDRVDRDSIAGRRLEAATAWYGCISGEPADEALARFRRAFEGSTLVTALADDALLLVGMLLGVAATDDLDLADRLASQMLAEGQDRGLAINVANAHHMSANIAHRRGDLHEAEAHAAAATAAYRELNAPPASVPIFIGFQVQVLTERGELDAAARELAAAGWDEAMPDHWWYAGVLWARGYLRLATGRVDEGIEDLLEFARRDRRDGVVPTIHRPWASQVAPLLAQRGDREQARELIDQELAEARAWGTPRTIAEALRGRGLVTGGAEGLELLREAVATVEPAPARLELARALVDLGAALRRANRRAEARDPLRRGVDLAHHAGARLLAARGEQELRATGAKPRRQVLSGVEALTASERRIADMAAEGRTNREIAQALFVTAKTVETHMGHVLQKLDVRGRGEIAAVLSATATG